MRKSPVYFKVEQNFSISVDDGFIAYESPHKWGKQVAINMGLIINEFDQKLNQCVRDLSERKVVI